MSTDRQAFLAAILADPADDTPRLAYADWLRETGDPHDDALGRFIAAGLILHHTRAPEAGNEGPYYDALRDQADTARDVIAARAAHLLGWGGGGWAWDNDAAAPGRVTARLLPPATGAPVRALRAARRNPPPAEALVYERGSVAGARLSLRAWAARGRGLLERCPLAWAEVLDVPGLSVRFERLGPDRWRAVGRIEVPGTPDRHPPLRGVLVPGTPPYVGEDEWPHQTASGSGADRETLCRAARHLVWSLVEHLAHTAGPRWPGPMADVLHPSLFAPQDDVIPHLGPDGLDPEDRAALDDMLDSPSYD